MFVCIRRDFSQYRSSSYTRNVNPHGNPTPHQKPSWSVLVPKQSNSSNGKTSTQRQRATATTTEDDLMRESHFSRLYYGARRRSAEPFALMKKYGKATVIAEQFCIPYSRHFGTICLLYPTVFRDDGGCFSEHFSTKFIQVFFVTIWLFLTTICLLHSSAFASQLCPSQNCYRRHTS